MQKYYLYPLLWLIFVTGLSVMPGVQLPKFDLFSSDKLAHAFVYGVLCILILYGWKGIQRKPLIWAPVLMAVCISAAYGIMMEFVQYAFIPGRMYEVDDMIANAAGAMTGGGISKIWWQKNSNFNHKNG
jgi:VanZ family protein